MKSANYCCTILMNLEFSRQIFEKKYSNIKFLKNSTSGNRVARYRQTDMTKLVGAFSQFL